MISQGFFTAPEFPFTDEFVRQTAAKLGLPFDLYSLCVYDREIELALLIAGLEELDSQDFDFREILGRTDDPPDFWRRSVSLIYASGKFASEWRSASVTLGALAYLTTTRCWNAAKDQRAIVLSDVKATKRRKVDVTSVNGLSLDDDGVIGREQINPKYLLIAFGTASDGKDRDLIDCDAYREFAR